MAAQADARLITPPLPRALPPAARQKVHTAIESHLAAVEALTAFLDVADGDENLEPSLGSLELTFPGADQRSFNQERWAVGANDDRENEFDGREPDDEAGIVEVASSFREDL